ncbi:hypothetical protein GCM10028793_29970 [Nocardiopsis oceani]
MGGGHLTVLLPNPGRVGGGATGTGWGTGGLPSTMFRTGYHRVVVSVPRFVPDPGGVCWHGFQSKPLGKHGLVGLLSCAERSHRGHLL